jgi:hypothetical protein
MVNIFAGAADRMKPSEKRYSGDSQIVQAGDKAKQMIMMVEAFLLTMWRM